MYLDALSFLEDEREGWRAFEALDELTDDQLTPNLESVHGWSGRDLMAHLIAWLELGVTVAKELAINPSSRRRSRRTRTGTRAATRSTRRSGRPGAPSRWTRSGSGSGRCPASSAAT
jgi:hypothetical protein